MTRVIYIVYDYVIVHTCVFFRTRYQSIYINKYQYLKKIGQYNIRTIVSIKFISKNIFNVFLYYYFLKKNQKYLIISLNWTQYTHIHLLIHTQTRNEPRTKKTQTRTHKYTHVNTQMRTNTHICTQMQINTKKKQTR